MTAVGLSLLALLPANSNIFPTVLVLVGSALTSHEVRIAYRTDGLELTLVHSDHGPTSAERKTSDVSARTHSTDHNHFFRLGYSADSLQLQSLPSEDLRAVTLGPLPILSGGIVHHQWSSTETGERPPRPPPSLQAAALTQRSIVLLI